MITHGCKSLESDNLTLSPNSLAKPAHQRGQALVEFTLIFILLLVVAWIPADFGLAFYTGQIAQNAAREGARIAAADRTLVAGTTSCNMPGCYSYGNIFNETAARLPAAMIRGATITLTLDGGTNCDRLVKVSISGPYKFSFYQILRMLGFGSIPDFVTITRQTSMRWEHQC